MKSLITVLALAQILVGASAFAKCENSPKADRYKKIDIYPGSKTKLWSRNGEKSCTGTVYVSKAEPTGFFGLSRTAEIQVSLDNCSNLKLTNASEYSVGKFKLDTSSKPYYTKVDVTAPNGWSRNTADFVAASDSCDSGTKLYIHF